MFAKTLDNWVYMAHTGYMKNFRVNETSDKCFTCQIDDLRNAGVELSNKERNHWSMWGCTCSDEDAADAQEFMAMVTR
jgi:hypothetical protein